MNPSSSLPPEFASAFDAARGRLAPLGRRILFFTSIGSTNDLALSLADDARSEGTIVFADHQSAGRGRQGRAWFSPPGGGLYVSVILRPASARATAGKPESAAASGDRTAALLTLAAGVALAEAVESVASLRPDIKWPNDLLVGRRKLAGILAESVGGDAGAVVLGYGINVRGDAYPSEIRSRATSLESELGRPIDRAALWVETLAALAARYRDLLDGRFDAILDAWRSRSPSSRNARVSWITPDGPESGITCGIDDHGALLVAVGGCVERIVGGEVVWS